MDAIVSPALTSYPVRDGQIDMEANIPSIGPVNVGSVLADVEGVDAQGFAALFCASPELFRMLQRLAEKTRRVNAIQHSGGTIEAEDWSELHQLTNEAFGVLDLARNVRHARPTQARA